MRTPRALLVILGCAALALAAVQGLTGMQELVFYAGPFLLLIGLLLSGRFIGEDAILARRATPRRGCGRPARRWSPVRERPLASLLERSTRQLRGPPVRGASPRLRPSTPPAHVRRSLADPRLSPPRWSRCCSARPWPSPTRATRTTARRHVGHARDQGRRRLGPELRRPPAHAQHERQGRHDPRLPDRRSRTRSCSADGTVQVNTNSEAYYLNEDRLGETSVPTDLGAEPKWKQLSQELALRVARPPRALDGQERPAQPQGQGRQDQDRRLDRPDRGRRRRRARSPAR